MHMIDRDITAVMHGHYNASCTVVSELHIGVDGNGRTPLIAARNNMVAGVGAIVPVSARFTRCGAVTTTMTGDGAQKVSLRQSFGFARESDVRVEYVSGADQHRGVACGQERAEPVQLHVVEMHSEQA